MHEKSNPETTADMISKTVTEVLGAFIFLQAIDHGEPRLLAAVGSGIWLAVL